MESTSIRACLRLFGGHGCSGPWHGLGWNEPSPTGVTLAFNRASVALKFGVALPCTEEAAVTPPRALDLRRLVTPFLVPEAVGSP